MQDMRIGYGYDVHKLTSGRPLIVGGVTIPHDKGLAGHSDADVLLHAICDAMLGALALGDIGKHFPDDDQEYRDIDSRVLLRKTNSLVTQQGFSVNNIDATVVAQKPRMAPHIQLMRSNIAEDLQVEEGRVSVKATTSERLGFEGKQQGLSASAVELLYKE